MYLRCGTTMGVTSHNIARTDQHGIETGGSVLLRSACNACGRADDAQAVSAREFRHTEVPRVRVGRIHVVVEWKERKNIYVQSAIHTIF